MSSPVVELDPSGLMRAMRAFTMATELDRSLTKRAADLLADQTQVPRLTGMLAASRQITAGPGESVIIWSTPYAAAVHKANPFAERAVSKFTEQTVDTIRAGISRLLLANGLR